MQGSQQGNEDDKFQIQLASLDDGVHFARSMWRTGLRDLSGF